MPSLPAAAADPHLRTDVHLNQIHALLSHPVLRRESHAFANAPLPKWLDGRARLVFRRQDSHRFAGLCLEPFLQVEARALSGYLRLRGKITRA